MISEFRGRNRFLSNFYPLVETTLHGHPTVENFFQAMKNGSKLHYEELKRVTPTVAKQRGRKCKLRPDWESIKLDVMLYALRRKFIEPELRKKLLATGNQKLMEGNHWHDTYWGIDLKTGKGENHLGKLIMQVRSEITTP